ncbi:hypothetical protein CDD80_1320 [Ophiocordyceps camponoti-rufipedis]|uniref:Kelch repeat protein n=1 Tax=Ophiocordyceps camponoti-rufipedis TaxID=2004952 RepID=A0A2C5ZAF0_9HYPO|nr:hypothetical protein CDD80_1320 [Ophiocordyceps camponoti-rufipedis]
MVQPTPAADQDQRILRSIFISTLVRVRLICREAVDAMKHQAGSRDASLMPLFRRRATHSSKSRSYVSAVEALITFNNTLSLPLDRSWQLGAAPYTIIDNHLPPPMNSLALWADERDRVLYRYGGEKTYGGHILLNENNHLWKFSPDGAGAGTWSIQPPQDEAFFNNLKQSASGSSVFCEGYGVIAGGNGNQSSDYSFVNGTGPVTLPGMVVHNADTHAWTNETITPFPDDSSLRDPSEGFTAGQAVCVTGFGPNPMVLFLGGLSWDLETLALYDLVTKSWLWQQTFGNVPRGRANYCAVGVRGPQGTLEVFIHGGNSATSGPLSDTYVLSLPAFTWFKLEVPAQARTDHACAVIGRRQMLISGGLLNRWDWKSDDSWIGAHKILDMSELQLTDSYDADAAAYEPARMIKDWYNKGGMANVQWSSSQVQSAFNKTIDMRETARSTSSVTSAPNTSSVGAIAGGTVGGIAAVLLLAIALFFIRRCGRRRRQKQESETSESEAVEPRITLDETAELETAGLNTAELETEEKPQQLPSERQLYEVP